uniref:Uncharacterized protein n=1 Tax=Octopus bimaculoides TaxID=37653 RepID=A0A0L8HFC3_OCTBM
MLSSRRMRICEMYAIFINCFLINLNILPLSRNNLSKEYFHQNTAIVMLIAHENSSNNEK